MPHTDQLDLALAYVLGDVSDEERQRIESLIASGDTELAHSVEHAICTLSELPRSLNSAIPPVFLKERIMSCVLESAYEEDYAEESEEFMPPVPFLTRVLNIVPGYGSTPVRKAIVRKRVGSRRTIGIAFLFLGGFFATGYAVEQVSHVVQKAEEARSRVVERARHTKAFVERFAETSEARTARLASAEAPESFNIGHAKASYASAELDELSIRPVSAVREASHASLKMGSVQTAPLAPQTQQSQSATVNLNSLEGALFFMSDHSGQHFSLRPVNSVSEGRATIYWNPARREALLTIQDLKATTEDQRYSLRYVLDDGTTEEIYHFSEPVDGGYHQLTLEHSPNHHVVGAQLFLESASNGQVRRETVLSAASRLQNK